MAIHCCLSVSTAFQDPSCNFQEEFMSFVGFLSSINSSYYICGDFDVYVNVPDGNGYKFMIFLDLCDLKQLVN